MFEKAVRRKLRFSSSKGLIGVEELWDLSLESLDTMAVALDTQKKNTTTSFLTTRTPKATTDDLQLEILLYILGVKLAEKEASKTRATKKAQLDFLRDIQGKKEMDKLSNTSLEDLEKMISNLEAEVA